MGVLVGWVLMMRKRSKMRKMGKWRMKEKTATSVPVD